MQNLPITTATQPVTPAQTPNPADSNAAQAAETFGNVLARQRANSGEHNTDPKGKGQTASSAAPSSSTDNLPAATGNELEAPIPDVISTLPGDMLAALLPSPANANSIAAKEKPVLQAPTPDGVNTLPSDMLAALLPSPSNANSLAAKEKPVLQAPTPDGVNTLPSDMLAALLPTPMPVQQGASTASRQQPTTANAQELIAVGAQGGIRKQLIAAGAPGGTRQQPAATNAQELIAAGTPGGTRQQPAAANAQELIAAGAPGGTRQQPAAANAQELIAAGAPGGTRQQPAAANAQELIAAGAPGGIRQQPAAANAQELIAAGASGGSRQFASAGQSIGVQTATSLFRAQSNTTPTVASTDTTQGKTFSTVLEILGKDAANTALSAGTTQASAQAALPDAITLASLTQSTAAPIAASQNGPIQATVNTPVTHDAWGDEFNQKITWLATQHEQTAELHLNPPHLGPLDVVLNISGDQATALFTSPHAAVREAVEQALPKLREMLADNGIMLGNAMVNDQSPKEQQAGQADKQRSGNASLPGRTGDAIPAGSTVWPARRHEGMVDTFA